MLRTDAAVIESFQNAVLDALEKAYNNRYDVSSTDSTVVAREMVKGEPYLKNVNPILIVPIVEYWQKRQLALRGEHAR